MRVGGRIHR